MSSISFFPFPVLQTERLTLRQPVTSDDHAIFKLRSDDKINRFLGREPATSIDDARKFLETILGNINQNNSVYWAITLNIGGELVGTVCLFGFTEDDKHAEIGYELLPGCQGQGFMQEAVSAVIAYASRDLGLHSIEANTHPENLNSTRLLEKLNFKPDGAGEDELLRFKLNLPVT